MRISVLSFLIAAAAQLGAQITHVSAPEPLERMTRDGSSRIAVDANGFLTIRGAASQETKSAVSFPQGIRDLDSDSAGDVYVLTNTNNVAKWRPQSAGLEYTRELDAANATAIGVDAAGSRLFVAVSGVIWMLDAETGEVVLRGSQKLENVTRLTFDENANILYAQGKDYIAGLPATLDRADVFSSQSSKSAALPGASRNLPGLYTVGFRIEPPSMSVNPGEVATFYIRVLHREIDFGSFLLTVESPNPGTLSRNVMTVNDAVNLNIPIPANQPPGVYRVVAKLDNGVNGYASAVYIVPFPRSTNVILWGTGLDPGGRVAQGLVDPHYRIINPIDEFCQVAIVPFRSQSPIGVYWSEADGQSEWISGRNDPMNGCVPGLFRYRTDIDLREFTPSTANIAVAVWADNGATLEINGNPIAGEPQEFIEPESFRIARVYGIPREFLRQGSNALDFIVRNDNTGTARNPSGLRVEILHATAVPVSTPEPPPVGDFWLSATPTFKFVFGTTAHYTITVNRVGGFVGTPQFSINILPPTGYSATFFGNELTVTRDPNVTTAPQVWRFAVLGIFNQTTRSVDVAYIQNPLPPVDLPLFSTGVVTPGVAAAANTVDLHYVLAGSPDPAFPGPAALVANELTSPIGPWFLNDQFSRWIGPRADANNSNVPGVYRYQTSFDLGLGAADQAAIALRWAADNAARVFLNGLEVLGLENIQNFRRLNEALITTGFRPGLNTLEFAVDNANLSGNSPTGLRVEVLGAQASRNPNRVVQVRRGQTVTGPVPLAAGAFTHNAPAGITIVSNGVNLLFTATDAAPIGLFPMRVTYTANSSTFDILLVIGARNSVPYIVNSTGQADEGSVDPNYRMTLSPDPIYPAPNAWVIFSNTSPISIGFWAKNTINSRWIAPRRDALNPNAPGTYRYRTTFDMSGRNLGDAVLALEWAADNRGRIELNGGIQDRIDIADGFRVMRPVSITSGFVPGINTLDFVVINDGGPNEVNPTGLHVNILGAFAVSQGTAPGPDFALTPEPDVRQINAGQSTTFNIRVNPNFTFDQFVDFSVVNPPSGFSFSFAPVSTKVATVLTVTASPQVRSGRYTIPIRGRWGDIIRDVSVLVDIVIGANSLLVPSTGEGAAAGEADLNYKLIDPFGNARNSYVADLTDTNLFWSNGKWIIPSPTVEQRAVAGTYRYRVTFNTTGYDPSSVVITGIWDADDGAIAVLNGDTVAVLQKPSLLDPGTLRIVNGFRAGVNTLDFVVTNIEPSPTGLMVRITSVTANPVP